MSTPTVGVSELTRDRLDALVAQTPASGPKRSLGVIAVVATLGSLLFGYDTGVISGALPYMYLPGAADGLSLTTNEEGWIGGLLCLGAAIGASVGGKLSDKYGRRHNITLLAIVFLIGAVGCALSPNIWILYVFRIILGFAVGGASATVPVFLGETAPKRIRGTLVAVDQMMIVFGQFLAFSMNAALAQYHGGPSVESGGETLEYTNAIAAQVASGTLAVDGGNGMTWRYMLILASLPAIFLWIGIRLMPESSRWYVANMRIPEAIGSLKRVRDEEKDGSIADEVDEMLEVQRKEANQEKWSLSQIWGTKWTRHLLVIGIILGLADQLTGINTAMYYTPKVLAAAGFPMTDAISLNVISGGISFLGSAAGLWFVTRFARRHVGIYQESAIVISLGLLAAVFFFLIEPFQTAEGDIVGAPAFAPVLVLIIVCLFVFAKQSGTVTWVLVSEIFPMKIRGTALGMAVGALWIANAIVSIVFPIMMAHLGGAGTYLVFCLINVASLLFYIKFVPETKYDSLEELEVRFEKEYS
ncbi:MFS transporter [Schaalia hyovaginalis]|uniref:Major inositol transporter-like SP family MFS transporter n=1 Tax=Schaalia hyovaginalis TaxID=29316 RepID=A0A923IY96_9ACTO|nr:MFS transporter [Schaalia hyovaginalis]MBB6334131.1 major inositol transporter-like SP family MFS transporter [Schaalia hyovaginalis]